MDLAELARVAVTVMDPFLKAAGPILLEEGIKFGLKQIKPLYGIVYSKLTEAEDPKLLELLQALEKDPENKAKQAALIEGIQGQLEADPAFAGELVSSLRTTLQDPATVNVLIDRVGTTETKQIIISYGPVFLEQLPLGERFFVGREQELERLKEGLSQEPDPDDPLRIWAVVGMGGVGKSALALEAAHDVKESFPDGQLYVDLRGGLEKEPLEPQDVLAGFLRDLGVADQSIPPTLQERSRLFRAKLVGKRMLLLLDNARDAAQIEPLLPGSSSCVLLVTSRDPLARLSIPAQMRIELDLLPAQEGRLLLEKLVDRELAEEETKAADRIIGLCGRLPLALRIAGGILSVRNHLSLEEYATRLKDRVHILEGLVSGEMSVRASFDLSYQDLNEDQALLFRCGGLLPAADFDADLATDLLDVDLIQARDLADALVDMQLLQWSWGTRYRYHDLVREYAREKAADDPEEFNKSYRKKVVFWYRDQVTSRNETVQTYLHRQAGGALINPNEDTEVAAESEPSNALSWFEAERLNILAVLEWAVELGEWWSAVRLAGEVTSLLNLRGYWSDWEAVQNHALKAAERLGDPKIEADVRTSLGAVYRLQGRSERAGPHLAQALELRREAGDRAGEALTMNELGLVLQRMGRREQAGDLFKASLSIYRQIDDPGGESMVLNQLGNLRRLQGRWDQAIQIFQEALAISERHGDVLGKAISLNLMANVYRLKGEWEVAIRHFKDSLAINRDLGNKYGETIAVGGLGNLYRGQGRWKHALDMYRRNLQLADELGDLRGKSITLNNLGRVYNKMGTLAAAKEELTESLSICENLGLLRGESIARRVLGEVLVKQGDFDTGITRIKESLKIAEKLGDPRCTAQSLNGLGWAYIDRPDKWEKARTALEKALSIRVKKGDTQGQGQTKMNLGLLARRQGENEEAIIKWREGLEVLDSDSYEYREIEKLISRVERQEEDHCAGGNFSSSR